MIASVSVLATVSESALSLLPLCVIVAGLLVLMVTSSPAPGMVPLDQLDAVSQFPLALFFHEIDAMTNPPGN